jgi:hypothetical protein
MSDCRVLPRKRKIKSLAHDDRMHRVSGAAVLHDPGNLRHWPKLAFLPRLFAADVDLHACELALQIVHVLPHHSTGIARTADRLQRPPRPARLSGSEAVAEVVAVAFWAERVMEAAVVEVETLVGEGGMVRSAQYRHRSMLRHGRNETWQLPLHSLMTRIQGHTYLPCLTQGTHDAHQPLSGTMHPHAR